MHVTQQPILNSNERMTDICTAQSIYSIAPVSGKLIRVLFCQQGVVTTAPNLITVKIGATTVSTYQIETSFLDKAVNNIPISSNNEIGIGTPVEIISDGAGSGTVHLSILLFYQRDI